MSSDSPRTRIDQFFSARKKKPVSTSPKVEKTEKLSRIELNGSPNAKGTLGSYLANSNEVNCLAKRKLTPDEEAPETAQKPVFSLKSLEYKEHSQNKEISEAIDEEVSCEISAGHPGSESVLTTSGCDNVKLREVAADFISLYCGQLPSGVSFTLDRKSNGQKRNGSPSLLVSNSKACKKQQLTSDDDLSSKEVAICSHKEATGHAVSCSSIKPEEAVSGHFGEKKDMGLKTFVGLRKCGNTPEANLHVPGLSMNAVASYETPKSVYKNKLMSPGDAFWNEAIQVADGLFVSIDQCSVQIEKANNIVEGRVLERRLISESVQCAGESICLEMVQKETKENDKLSSIAHIESSPLPVKHFDFSVEEKSSNEINVCLDDEVPKNICGLRRGEEQKNFLSQGNNVITVGDDNNFFNTPKIIDNFSIGPSAPSGSLYKFSSKETRHYSAYKKVNEACTPSSSMPPKDSLLLSSWLPPEICHIYMNRGISKLYPWQVECLQVDGVLQRRNLVYCASTSAGKSFVAEILMLRRVICTGKMALLVLPYVSICAEKAEHLEQLLGPLGKHVCSFYGNQGGASLPKDTSVAVCTIEKANFLVNRLLEEGRLSELGIIVIDELHMVGDQSRGYLLELLLTKLRYAAGEGNAESCSGDSSGSSSGKVDSAQGLQIVGMSATMPNVAAVADWLQAALYQTDFRPVPLEEYIKVGNSIFNKQMEIVRTIPKTANLGGKDPDHIVELCNEVVQEGHSVLLFCSSRKGCESTARHVSKFLKTFSAITREGGCEYADASSAIDGLRKCPAGLDPVLEETLPSGVAYHHAGLTVEEREIVETCYRKGLVRVLAATSTLAAGVNMPARRVIFRQPRIGRDFIDGTRYRQMSGRAGRTGIDTRGESILLCKPEEIKRIMTMLNDQCPALQSCLSEDKNGMTHAILEVVASGIVQTAADIHRYVRCTLLNSMKPFQDVVASAQDSLRWLCHRKLLEWNEETKLYSTTPLGRAAFGSSLNPEESLVVLEDLSRAREGFVLASDLHLLYLVTPINVEVEPDWELYYERFMELSVLDQAVGNRVGILEPFLMRMAHGATVHIHQQSKGFKNVLNGRSHDQTLANGSRVLSDEQMLRVCKRFYVSLILSRLVQEVSVLDVCEAFKVSRGMVQALQENAGRFASMVSLFCERLGWHDIEGLVAKFQNRVSFGVRAEIVELTNIPYVKGSRARALYKAGLRTTLAIAEASVQDIANALFDTSLWAEQAAGCVLANGHELKSTRNEVNLIVSVNNEICGSKSDKREQKVVQNTGNISDNMKISNSKNGPVNADSISGGFDSFLDMWDVVNEFFFDVHFTRRSKRDLGPFEIHGLAICWENSPVYYINISKDLITAGRREYGETTGGGKGKIEASASSWGVASSRWDRITKIMERMDIKKITWNLKVQIQALKKPGISVQRFGVLDIERGEKGIELVDNLYILPSVAVTDAVDICLVAWILWPDEESSSTQNLEKEVKTRLSSEAAAAANRDGMWRNQMRRVAHNGCCRRVAQTRALCFVLWKLLISENLIEPLVNIEIPLVKVLADMECWGIGVDMEFCLRVRHVLGIKLKELEKEAYKLAGMTFSLYNTPDIAHVLFGHLKLPIPEGSSKGKHHPSTDKHSLDALRHHHPIISVIKEHRTLSKLLHSTLGSICSKSGLCLRSQKYRISGNWLQTSTATGRLSMEEPNLQCVEHTVEFMIRESEQSNSSSTVDCHQINARDFLIPSQDNWLLLGADYSQIELRLMAHFSKDSTLTDLLSKPDGDVFRLIAARWTGQLESNVSSKDRDQTKKLVYGILYGMGANTLSEQLCCTLDEASKNIQSFKSSFPHVANWLDEAVASCRKKGYVETLKGRKRFLSKIKFGNSKEKAKAQRQAVNSICQGSAADIIKIAMIKIHSVIAEERDPPVLSTSHRMQNSLLRGRCRILLQVHDELLLEADPAFVREAGLLLKESMETAVSLLVPLHVKMKVGKTWGSLEPYQPSL
ncbi:helicase and polymerase-containing protein TEBICHI isoform X2 [Aristolochia californica]|uniref:helicase and polymerase-containing protein TEBICHI isoform X2 n=1 Tax=Aristolochia californica TaxID=171875 RepID=UPI0035DF2EF4